MSAEKDPGCSTSGKLTIAERLGLLEREILSEFKCLVPPFDVKCKADGSIDVDALFSPEVKKLLERVDEWDFDVFALVEATGGKPLFTLAFHLLNTRTSLVDKLKLDALKLARFLHTIEAGYFQQNSYHNNTHASDMLQTIHHFIISAKEAMRLTDVEHLSLLLSAAVHDYKHPGVNNAFLAAIGHPIAIRYNDTAVLENFHCSEAFLLLRIPELNFMESLDAATRKTLRDVCITSIIATDMAQHGGICNSFRVKLDSFDLDDAGDRHLMFKMLIKGADISNTAKPQFLYEKWCDRVMEEFYQQGDKEKELGITVSPFCDRETTSISKCQIGFISFVVGPMFSQLDDFMAAINSTGWVSHSHILTENCERWKAQAPP